MDKKSKHKTAVKKKTLNPEFNEVQGAGEAMGKPLPLPWGDWVFQGSLWELEGGKRPTGEPPAVRWGSRGRRSETRLNQAEVQTEARGSLQTSSEDGIVGL